MDLSTGKLYTDFDSGKRGMQVAIYARVAVGGISLTYPQEKSGAGAGRVKNEY